MLPIKRLSARNHDNQMALAVIVVGDAAHTRFVPSTAFEQTIFTHATANNSLIITQDTTLQ